MLMMFKKFWSKLKLWKKEFDEFACKGATEEELMAILDRWIADCKQYQAEHSKTK